VRKAFLCGVDKESGVSYEHRRTWIEKRTFQLAQVFAIDICAHAVMHNHLHLVLHVDSERVKKWSTTEILQRWHQVFKGTLLTQKYTNKQSLDKFQLTMVESIAVVYKQRLIDISWFMRSLNEPIARVHSINRILRVYRMYSGKRLWDCLLYAHNSNLINF
jgi:hypothetical protein